MYLTKFELTHHRVPCNKEQHHRIEYWIGEMLQAVHEKYIITHTIVIQTRIKIEELIKHDNNSRAIVPVCSCISSVLVPV